ncbi:chloramphenicol phosphotransferase CPT family protein [Devosia sp. BK]|uniref:chloramphenicol phosphotransferase CPT family protein n=1 Tax=Devosia sp. BK TaxID=2871706 RepID=UPI00293A32D4|nr:AAA family ATPase [Devosia sp. BK]MDV3251155.1 chloramphenicol phosphotransferase CPT family protein [Devosia sp. BK]
MTSKASIIFLHGASSSGKSTLAREIQAKIERPFWHISIDHLRDSGVLPLGRVKAGDFKWRDMRAPFFAGYHASLAAYAEAGNNLIIEHILDTPGWQLELAELFAPFDVLFVALHCEIEELRRREYARGDRPVGSAEQDALTIHEGRRYDLELQTADGVDANAAQVMAAWREPRAQSRFFEVTEGK